MEKHQNNFAFIDSQNLNLSILAMGWKLDFNRFRIYLKDKYSINQAFIFIGYVEGNNQLYSSLQKAGFICIFKPTLIHNNGRTKGNCDTDLVLHAMIEYQHYDKAMVATGDGDFYCLIKYLIENQKLQAILIPNRLKFSALLRFAICRPYIRYMNDLKDKLSYSKEKTPRGRNLQG